MYEQKLGAGLAGMASRNFTGPTDSPVAPRPVGHVGDQFEEATRLTQALAQEIESLEMRIGSILRPTPPTATGGVEASNRPVMSVHAEGLASINSGLYMAVQRVRDLAARADL